MEYSNNEVKVGAMLMIGFTLLLVFLVAIFGVDWNKSTHEYHTELKQIPGIVEGSVVKFGGMDVGHVSAISLPETNNQAPRIRLTLQVNDKTPVRVNSVAYVTSIGIMADQHIEISPGTPDASLLPSGGLLESKEVLSFAQMAEPFGQLSAQLEELINRINDTLSEENRRHISSMLAGMDTLMNDGGSRFVQVVDNLDKLTVNLAEASNNLNALMAENRDNLNETLTHLEASAKETTALIADLRHSLEQLETVVSSNGVSILEMMENFQYTSQNLEEFSRAVKERPWLLVRKSAPPQRKLP